MSDMHPHARDDIAPPTDSSRHVCECSWYLCETCNPRRSIIRVIRDVSVYRDLPMSYYELIRPRPKNVVSLSERRHQPRPLIKGSYSL